MMFSYPDGAMFIYTEYCPGPFYMGWWMYACPIVDNKPVREKYVWVHDCEWMLIALAEALQLTFTRDEFYKPRGLRNPSPEHQIKFDFMERYPFGAICATDDKGHHWHMVEAKPSWEWMRIIREGQLQDIRNATSE